MAASIYSNPVELFIGIDVHLKSWHVSICSQSMTLKSFSQPPQVDALVNYLHRNYPEACYHSAYEAGFCGFWLHQQLTLAGIDNIVVNACDVPTTDKEKRQKRDRIDSLKLARSLRSGQLKGIYVPDLQQQYARNLTRTRAQLVQEAARFKQRIKSLLHAFGIVIPEQHLRSKGYWTRKFKAWIAALDYGPPGLPHLLETLEDIQRRLKEVEGRIDQLARSDAFALRMELICSVPGISRTSGMVLLTELCDVKRFGRFDELCSYVGLVPNVRASGQKEYTGRITKRGNNRIRETLVECAWTAIRKDPALAMSYEKMKYRMGGNKAIIRIARKLLSRIRYVLVNENPYQIGFLCEHTQHVH